MCHCLCNITLSSNGILVLPVFFDGVSDERWVGVRWGGLELVCVGGVMGGVGCIMYSLYSVTGSVKVGVRLGGLEWVLAGAAWGVRVSYILPVLSYGVGEVRIGGEGWYIGVLILAQLSVPRVSALGPRQLLRTRKKRRQLLSTSASAKKIYTLVRIYITFVLQCNFDFTTSGRGGIYE